MATYAIDSKRQGMRCTGVVNPVFDWVEGDAGKRKQSTEQARDKETGMPLWEVEVLYQQVSYGRVSNTTGIVRCGSPVQPVVAEFAPVEFLGLVAEVRVKNGSLIEYWSAEDLADSKSSDKPAQIKAAS